MTLLTVTNPFEPSSQGNISSLELQTEDNQMERETGQKELSNVTKDVDEISAVPSENVDSEQEEKSNEIAEERVKRVSTEIENKENISEPVDTSGSGDKMEISEIEGLKPVEMKENKDVHKEDLNNKKEEPVFSSNISDISHMNQKAPKNQVNKNMNEEKPEASTTKGQEESMDINEESKVDSDSKNTTEGQLQTVEEVKNQSFDSPPRMPGRGKKRGRTSDITPESPEAKKRVKEKLTGKVFHPTHPDFSKTGVALTLGEGDVGQLGLGEDIIERARPALLKLDDPMVQVCAGGMHTACLTNEGKMYTFGCNDESALGRDTSEEGSETLPTRLDLPYKIIQVTCGDSHTAILTDDGHVYAWGNFRDANGSMGLTARGISTEPLEMLPGETVVKIASGGDHLVCLTDKGEIFTGGCAEQGQLGRVAECFAGRGGRKGLDSILKMGPVRCKKHGSRKKATWSDIWAGQYVTFAKEEDTGDIYSWGLNNYFQIGFDDMQNRFVPEWVSSFAKHDKKWVKVQAGQHHTMLLDEAGKVYTLGRAEYGRLGIGENPGEKSEPTLVTKLPGTKCIDIAAGQSVSMALMEDGVVFGWGMGTSKQLGTGDEEDVWELVQMKGKQLENRFVIGVSAGGQHTALLARDKS